MEAISNASTEARVAGSVCVCVCNLLSATTTARHLNNIELQHQSKNLILLPCCVCVFS